MRPKEDPCPSALDHSTSHFSRERTKGTPHEQGGRDGTRIQDYLVRVSVRERPAGIPPAPTKADPWTLKGSSIQGTNGYRPLIADDSERRYQSKCKGPATEKYESSRFLAQERLDWLQMCGACLLNRRTRLIRNFGLFNDAFDGLCVFPVLRNCL